MFRSVADRLRRLAKHVMLTLLITRSNISAAMEFRTSFWIQVIGMLLNDVAMMTMWYIFFTRFPSINGWGFRDTIMIWSITTTSFGILMTTSRGAFEIARGIAQGELDYYLAFPRDVLWHMSVSKSEIAAIGDLIFGIVLFFASGDITIERFVIFVAMSALSAMICWAFIVTTQSIGFFVRNFEEGAQDFFHALLGLSMYPQNVYRGWLKVLTYTVLPTFFAYFIPLTLMREFKWELIAGIVGFWIVSCSIAMALFRYGLRRYESGNLIQVKM
jgi:ABC-2 type transport system permease protein